MLDSISKVAEFHRTTGAPILPAPEIPSNKRIDLRIDLLREEVSELEEAAFKGDLTAVLDALCDIQYVLYGAALEFGMQGVLEEGFNEVHRSNMSKFTVTTQDAQKAVANYNYKGVEVYYQLVNKLHVIMRTSDDKVLKGINYFKPGLKAILDKFKKTNKQ